MRINKTLGTGLVAVLLSSIVMIVVPVNAMPAQAIWVEPTIIHNLNVGDTFIIDVMVNITDPPGVATGMFGFEYKLFWNTSIQLTSCTTRIPGGWGSPNGFLVKNQTGVWPGPSLPEKIGLGYHWYSYTCLTGPVFTGVMSLCTYTFKYNLKGNYVLDLHDIKIADDTATLISPLGVYDGYVTPPVHNINTGLSYLTIQDAIDAPETWNGHTLLVDAGTYYEHVVVNKRLSIIGENKYNTVIDGNGTGNVINITVNDVRIAEFTIQNSGLGYPDSGIFVHDSHGNNISQNIISANVFGIHLNSSGDNIIDGNKVSLNSDSGIVLDASSHNTLVNNDLLNNDDAGIRLYNSNNNSIVENNVLGNWKGIKLYTSLHNTLEGNDVSNNDYGIELTGSSSNNTLIGNTVSNNDYGIELTGSSSNNTLIGNTVSNNDYGVYFESSNNTISENDIPNNWIGIELYASSYNSISGNNITAKSGSPILGYGIELYISSNNSISGNNIKDNVVSGIGVHGSSNNSIYGNNINNNEDGIVFTSSSYNIISGNNVANNEDGIQLDSSSNNSIYHNNFKDNTEQAYSSNSTNVWDDGYPSGGNFWSDHNPPDVYSGHYQNETGRDKIGDILYIIGGNNTDRYPLIYPYGYVPTIDVNNDGLIDIVDIVFIALAFGSKPGDPNWNPYADLNQDGIVDIVDIVMIAIHFGETYP
jgi:parallel beta-helix repeat protein